ncbi:hypothetical protein GGTG_05263 [Gaeumannomyces tritici R3-111a-1]|uniref:Uncharacterized protein n=1 Tax=Gaeumannomyces tritici (strain R3-111a-1) TaxID=644352 RepID=J3NVF0_GAET3|nr:hypothetical protein GGTG_05263 [Gaeumannomyces tritici R3-111a-1]EJT75326.1 hypothetical protein GGTG_05263 [Gaeumannomyces tritici R3-111a-1]
MSYSAAIVDGMNPMSSYPLPPFPISSGYWGSHIKGHHRGQEGIRSKHHQAGTSGRTATTKKKPSGCLSVSQSTHRGYPAGNMIQLLIKGRPYAR